MPASRAAVTSGGEDPLPAHRPPGSPPTRRTRACVWRTSPLSKAAGTVQRPEQATPGQRPRHPSGSQPREPGQHSGDSGFPGSPRDAKVDRIVRHRGGPSTATRRYTRQGSRGKEGRAGGRPAAGRGEPRKWVSLRSGSPSGRSPAGTCTAALSPHTCPDLAAPF